MADQILLFEGKLDWKLLYSQIQSMLFAKILPRSVTFAVLKYYTNMKNWIIII